MMIAQRDAKLGQQARAQESVELPIVNGDTWLCRNRVGVAKGYQLGMRSCITLDDLRFTRKG